MTDASAVSSHAPGAAGQLIATILRHDRRTASYKLALIRSLNDLALGYPHLTAHGGGVALPLRLLVAL